MLRLAIFATAAAGLAACSPSTAADAAGQTADVGDAAHPVVVELYESQGCSSCPPANAAVNAIAGRPGILALNFAVTYWDQLGWKDTFADPAYTRRQWDYARAAGRGNVGTPQVIVNGHSAIVGSNPAQLAQTIANEGPAKGGPAISISGNTVRVGQGSGQTIIWAVRYDPRVRDVAIRAGENGGRTLPHKNVVRQLTMLGRSNGAAATFTLPGASEPGLSTAVLTQAGVGGRITGALKI